MAFDKTTATLRTDVLTTGQQMQISPLAGYRGVIVVQINDNPDDNGDPVWDVVLYVDALAQQAVSWKLKADKDFIIDVPEGFNIANGHYITQIIVAQTKPGKIPPGSVAGHP